MAAGAAAEAVGGVAVHPGVAVPPRMAFGRLVVATKSFSEQIGEGATGEVYRGDLDGVPVAVKRLKLAEGATMMARAELKRRFEAEFNTLASYQHVRLVRLLGWAQDEDPAALHPFALVFELLEGGSLADWLLAPSGEEPPGLRGSPLAALARVEIALGVGAGLGYLHGLREQDEQPGGAAAPPDAPGTAHAALHRDVKSANVGLSPREGGSPYSKILDCGLAKAVNGGAAAAAVGTGASFTGGLVAGTPGYMAPEVANGKYTVQSEVYSFGVVLLELFLGQRVAPDTAMEIQELADDDGEETLVARADPNAEWPVLAAEALAALILKCIHPRAKRRPVGVAAVVAGLQQVRVLADVKDTDPLVKCIICWEELSRDMGVQCRGERGHFVCRGCLQEVSLGVNGPCFKSLSSPSPSPSSNRDASPPTSPRVW